MLWFTAPALLCSQGWSSLGSHGSPVSREGTWPGRSGGEVVCLPELCSVSAAVPGSRWGLLSPIWRSPAVSHLFFPEAPLVKTS